MIENSATNEIPIRLFSVTLTPFSAKALMGEDYDVNAEIR